MPVHSYSRCVVTLQTSLEAVEYPEGYDFGSLQHRTPEEALGDRLAVSAARLEVLFDELEAGGRRFVSPGSSSFDGAPRQRVMHGDAERFTVELSCVPPFSTEELTALGARVASLINTTEVTPLEVHSVDVDTDPGDVPPVRADAPTRPHGVEVAQRRDDAPTRPEGVMSIPGRAAVPEASTPIGSPSVSAPRRRDDAVTRPQGVMAIRPPRKT
jgi:hypothetical protein